MAKQFCHFTFCICCVGTELPGVLNRTFNLVRFLTEFLHFLTRNFLIFCIFVKSKPYIAHEIQ